MKLRKAVQILIVLSILATLSVVAHLTTIYRHKARVADDAAALASSKFDGSPTILRQANEPRSSRTIGTTDYFQGKNQNSTIKAKDGPTAPAPTLSDESRNVLKQAHAAIQAAKKLQSGHGIGTWELFHPRKDQTEYKLTLKAKMEIYFDQDKRYTRFEFVTADESGFGRFSNPLRLEREVAIFDGSAFFRSKFSSSIRPHGCEAEIHRSPTDEPGHSESGDSRFMFMDKHVLNLEKFTDKEFMRTVTVTKEIDSHYRVRYPLGNQYQYYRILEIAPEVDFHVTRVSRVNDGGLDATQEWRITWKKTNDLWHMTGHSHTQDPHPKISPPFRFVVKYDKFEPNAKVPANVFTLAALELKEGARILDKRPGKNVACDYKPRERAGPKKPKNMLEEVESLPRRDR